MAFWYYHCLICGYHFKLGKATKFSLDKIKTKLFCPRCGKNDRIEPSFKEEYDKEHTYIKRKI